MIWLFCNFQNVSFMCRPISIWAEGDTLIAELMQEANTLRSTIHSGGPSAASLHPILERIELINTRLTPLGDAFSYSLGEASRMIRDLLLGGLLAIAAVLTCLGSYISYYIPGRKESFEKELRTLTARTAVVRQRREADARIRDQTALLDKARDAIVVRGIDNRILYWNKSAVRLYGWKTAKP